jgi:uncharacterized membrane protein
MPSEHLQMKWTLAARSSLIRLLALILTQELLLAGCRSAPREARFSTPQAAYMLEKIDPHLLYIMDYTADDR